MVQVACGAEAPHQALLLSEPPVILNKQPAPSTITFEGSLQHHKLLDTTSYSTICLTDKDMCMGDGRGLCRLWALPFGDSAVCGIFVFY